MDPQQGRGPLLLDVLISPSLLRWRGVRFWQCLRLISNSLFGLPHIYPGLKSTNNLFNTFLLSLHLALFLSFNLYQKLPCQPSRNTKTSQILSNELTSRGTHQTSCSGSPHPEWRNGSERHRTESQTKAQGCSSLCLPTPTTAILISEMESGCLEWHCTWPWSTCGEPRVETVPTSHLGEQELNALSTLQTCFLLWMLTTTMVNPNCHRS